MPQQAGPRKESKPKRRSLPSLPAFDFSRRKDVDDLGEKRRWSFSLPTLDASKSKGSTQKSGAEYSLEKTPQKNPPRTTEKADGMLEEVLGDVSPSGRKVLDKLEKTDGTNI